jgi:AbrB family looped-hinge helix DNA binding protein
MQTVTIGTKNQIVLPKEVRKKIKGLKPGTKVMVYPIDKETIGIKVSDKSWVENTYGLMKDAWKDIDPIKELEKMRNEWDEK